MFTTGRLTGKEEFVVLPRNSLCDFLVAKAVSLGIGAHAYASKQQYKKREHYLATQDTQCSCAVFVDRKKREQYYSVVYTKMADSPLYLMNLHHKTLIINCGITQIPLQPSAAFILEIFAKWGFEGYLGSVGIKMPWKQQQQSINKNTTVSVQQKKRKIKRCDHCRREKSSTVVLKLCARCKHRRYCSRSCQKKAWNRHHRHLCTARSS